MVKNPQTVATLMTRAVRRRALEGTMGVRRQGTVRGAERHASFEHMKASYRAAKQRRQVERAMELWQDAEADQLLARLEAPEEQIH